MVTYISNSIDETVAIAEQLAKQLKSGDIIALTGGLGAGKTALVRGIAQALGYNDYISSPTFTLVNEYDCKPKLYHFDVYRLENADIEELDWLADYLYGDGICIIEWADYIESILPAHTIKIEILKDLSKGESFREISVYGEKIC